MYPSMYIFEEEIPIDLIRLKQEIQSLEKELVLVKKEMEQYLEELGL